jgi:hypothetical protein
MSDNKTRCLPARERNRCEAAAMEAARSLTLDIGKIEPLIPELKNLSADERMRYVVTVDPKTGAASVERIGVVSATSK